MIAEQLWFADETPLAWKRGFERVHSIKEILRGTLDAKWQESTTGPDSPMPGILSDDQVGLRQKLLQCQGECKELKPLIESSKRLLTAGPKQSIVEDQKISQGYRLHPVDGLLEREVQVQKATIWVPVLPNVALTAVSSGFPKVPRSFPESSPKLPRRFLWWLW